MPTATVGAVGSRQGPWADGDKVNYWSASVNQWLIAKITKVNADGSYDLNCKKKVPGDKIYPLGQKGKPADLEQPDGAATKEEGKEKAIDTDEKKDKAKEKDKVKEDKKDKKDKKKKKDKDARKEKKDKAEDDEPKKSSKKGGPPPMTAPKAKASRKQEQEESRLQEPKEDTDEEEPEPTPAVSEDTPAAEPAARPPPSAGADTKRVHRAKRLGFGAGDLAAWTCWRRRAPAEAEHIIRNVHFLVDTGAKAAALAARVASLRGGAYSAQEALRLNGALSRDGAGALTPLLRVALRTERRKLHAACAARAGGSIRRASSADGAESAEEQIFEFQPERRNRRLRELNEARRRDVDDSRIPSMRTRGRYERLKRGNDEFDPAQPDKLQSEAASRKRRPRRAPRERTGAALNARPPAARAMTAGGPPRKAMGRGRWGARGFGGPAAGATYQPAAAPPQFAAQPTRALPAMGGPKGGPEGKGKGGGSSQKKQLCKYWAENRCRGGASECARSLIPEQHAQVHWNAAASKSHEAHPLNHPPEVPEVILSALQWMRARAVFEGWAVAQVRLRQRVARRMEPARMKWRAGLAPDVAAALPAQRRGPLRGEMLCASGRRGSQLCDDVGRGEDLGPRGGFLAFAHRAVAFGALAAVWGHGRTADGVCYLLRHLFAVPQLARAGDSMRAAPRQRAALERWIFKEVYKMLGTRLKAEKDQGPAARLELQGTVAEQREAAELAHLFQLRTAEPQQAPVAQQAVMAEFFEVSGAAGPGGRREAAQAKRWFPM
ncbi:unnamed protein product [Prorocentrum cordatum]|uniref:Uncharacterized protein n=1 Tax=Prorocentrum cordatum TaxID=2364126 RepID=A0ABN9TQJ4_9DINO|nr:unnamed protein product [Polarella glacialis]